MKLKFNSAMSIIWTIVAIISGMFSVVNGGAMSGDNLTDPSVAYIAGSFGIPAFVSIVFAFCNSVEDIVKLKSLINKSLEEKK